MNDITLFPADIAAMSVSQLAALPAAQKAEIDKNLDEALDWLKKARTKFDAALDAAYGEQARTALCESGRDFGTAHISDGPLHIKFELPKKVSWNQKQLSEIAERIVASGEKVEGYTERAVIPVKGDVPTIGFGTTTGVNIGDTTTPPKALARALTDVEQFEGALKTCVTVPLAQHEYDALVSFSSTS